MNDTDDKQTKRRDEIGTISFGEVIELVDDVDAGARYEVEWQQLETNESVAIVTRIDPRDQLVRNYLFLRTTLGILGGALPFAVLIVVAIFIWLGEDGDLFQASISAYYHTPARNVFVGIPIALGVFMLVYRGEKHTLRRDFIEQIPLLGRWDWLIRTLENRTFSDDFFSTMAGLGAIFVALLPTPPVIDATAYQLTVGIFHFISATMFFIFVALIALFSFPQSARPPTVPEETHNRRKRKFMWYGLSILLLIVLMGIYGRALPAELKMTLESSFFKPFFWLETLALLLFSAAWFSKGREFEDHIIPSVQEIVKPMRANRSDSAEKQK